jgi:hypothetical protein
MGRPDRAPDSAEEGPTTEKAPLKFRRAILVRVIAHLAAWLPFVIGTARLVHAGWTPTGDDAAIALRSWNSLTAHGPLVGQATRLAHGVFDPGPLEYWLLAIPVHISPSSGVLWGAAICCMAACSLAIEAAWAAGGELAGLTTSALIITLVLWIPTNAVRPTWNPYFGAIFFLAALATSWAVLCRHRGWWPVAVVTASIACQAHLMYALASVLLVAVTLVVGCIDTVRSPAARTWAGYRWLIIGLLLGAACWSGPFIQQFTSRNGNLSALIANSESGLGPRTGPVFGLRAISAAVQPIPIWLRTTQAGGRTASVVAAHSPWPGVVALVILVAVLVAALGPLRSRRLAGLAAVTLVLSLGALATYSSIPVRPTTLSTLGYLILLTLPLGVGFWLATVSVIVLAVRWARARSAATGPAAPALPDQPAGSGWLSARWASAVGIAGAVVVVVLAGLSVPRQSGTVHAVMRDPAQAATRIAASKIEHMLPGQRVALLVRDTQQAEEGRITVSLTWALTPGGFHAEVTKSRLARELGSSYVFRGRAMPLVTVQVHDQHVTVRVSKSSDLPASLRLASAKHGHARDCWRRGQPGHCTAPRGQDGRQLR